MFTSLSLLAACLPGIQTASAQVPLPVDDDFESYSVGPIAGQGPWDSWDGAPGADSSVSIARSYSGSKSLEIVGDSDTVIWINDTPRGCYTVRAKQFIPTNFTGNTYFIMLNEYQHGGPYTWSVELQFNGLTGEIMDDQIVDPLGTYVRDRWIDIGVQIDLSRDQQTVYYNGEILYQDTWGTHIDPDGVRQIQALDLYAAGSSSVYYDDVKLVPCMTMTGPNPGYPAVNNTFRVTGGTRQGLLAVMYGRQPGTFRVPGCPEGVTLPFTDPGFVALAIGDDTGSATLSREVPIQASGETATFIAIDRSVCRTSEPITFTFP